MKVVHTLLLALLVGASGCGSETTEPLVTSAVESFASRIQEKGSAWRSVTVTVAGTVTMQLVTMTQPDALVNMGIGTISGTKCVLAASVDTIPNSSTVAPQLTRTVSAGTYCVRIADIGNLRQLNEFTIRIERPL